MIQSNPVFISMDHPLHLKSIHHSGSSRYVFPNEAYLGDTVTIRLRAAADFHIKQVLLRTVPDGEQHLAPLQPEDLDHVAACRWWRISIRVNMAVTSYRFLIIADDGTYWYNGSGLHAYNPSDAEDFRILVDYQAQAG